nr:hypothetical protein [uncultured Rhodopila sp.]
MDAITARDEAVTGFPRNAMMPEESPSHLPINFGIQAVITPAGSQVLKTVIQASPNTARNQHQSTSAED